MSVKYFANSNQPVYKTIYSITPATTFTIWTPATSKSVALTDICVSGATAGTIRFFFNVADVTVGPASPIVEFIQAGSVVVKTHWDTPLVGTADQIIRCVAGGNGSVLSVTLAGFEQD